MVKLARVSPRTRTAKDYIYQQLTSAFLEGLVAPGDRLLEKEISEWLDVSRTPVREAFVSLEADGLVELVPHKGAVVRQLNPDDVRDQYVIRAALESLATELAVPNVDVSRLESLGNANAAFIKAQSDGDLDAALVANKLMHMLLYEASGSAKLIEAIESAWRRADYFRQFVYASQDGTTGENHTHAELLKAVSAGRAADASSLVKHSLLACGETLATKIVQLMTCKS